jgi:hypothetical protein
MTTCDVCSLPSPASPRVTRRFAIIRTLDLRLLPGREHIRGAGTTSPFGINGLS